MVYTPEQNGASERDNRTIVEAARSMLHTSNLPIRFWGEAVMTAGYVLNRTGTCTLEGMTPFEAWHKVKPFVAHLRVFGSDAYLALTRIHTSPKNSKRNGSPKAEKGCLWDIPKLVKHIASGTLITRSLRVEM
jgi:hypothetical protein